MALHLLFVALGVAVPLYGVLAWGWAVGTVMLLLALECLVSFGPMGARILRHERLTQDANHRRPSVYGRFGKWRIAAPAGRFGVDYLTRGGVAAAAAVFVACVIPLAYARKYPGQASLMQLQLDGVALGLALKLREGRTRPEAFDPRDR